MSARVGTVNPYAEPSTKKALAISESSSNAAAGLDEKSNKEVEVLINQPDNTRRDPTRIPQILTVVRTTIEGSEHPEYFNHVTLDSALVTIASYF